MNRCPLAVRTLSALLALTAVAVPAYAQQRVDTLRDIGWGTGNGDPVAFTEREGLQYFLAGWNPYEHDLWRTDGTTAGTVNVTNFPALAGLPPVLPNREMVRVGNTLFFTRWLDWSGGAEIWKHDGIAASMVTDLCPGLCGAPKKLTAHDGLLYFVEAEGEPGAELYRSDGTAAGTVLVKDINPGPAGSDPSFLTSFQGQLFFAASDGPTTRLWRSDGTGAGTLPVVPTGAWLLNPRDLTVVGDQLFFVAEEDLRRPEGTGTREVTSPGEAELWVTDGTPAGTRMVVDIQPGLPSDPGHLIAFGGHLYFTADDGAFGAELWRSDGTPEGTVRVSDIRPGPGGSSPQGLAVSGGALYFSADDGVTGRELWTAADEGAPLPAIRRVEDIVPGPGSSSPRDLADVDGTLFFAADGPEGTEVWRSFGWPQTTALVFDVQPGPGSSSPASFRAVPSGSVVFTATTDTQGNEPRVLHNRRPVADAGPGVAILPGESALLDATASSDEDGDPLFYEWRDGAGTVFAFGPAITVTPEFTTTYRLTVLDGFGGRATDTVTVTVDGTPNVTLALYLYSDSGGGAVTVDPPGAVCVQTAGNGEFCSYEYPQGTTVTLVASPQPGSTFAGWTGGPCTGTGACQVTLDESRYVEAFFIGPRPLYVTVESQQGGAGSIRVSPPEQFCTVGPYEWQNCQYTFASGALVSLQALPAPGSGFLGWMGGACSGTEPTCIVDMSQAQSVYAAFRGPQPLSVMVSSHENGSGSVHMAPPGQSCANSPGYSQFCQDLHVPGTVVTLTATPSADSVFMGWLGACSGVQPVCEVTVTDPVSTTAVFRGPQPLLTIVQSFQNGSGSVHVSPPNEYCANAPGTEVPCQTLHRVGTTVTLVATPSPDSVFMGWLGACSGVQPVCEVTVTDPVNATAVFRGPQSLALTLTGTEGATGRVDVSPAGASCELNGQPQVDCQSLHRPGDVVTLTAFAGEGSVFLGFTGCVGTTVCTVTMDEARAVSAAFRINHPPVASAGGPYTALRNVAITFDGSGSADPDGDLLTYAWDFGDGGTATGATPTHAYAAVGTYTVTLVVHDGRVASAPATATVTITNARPVAAIAGGDRTAHRGEALAFDGSGSTDGDGDGLAYAWDFGDGSTATGALASHAWSAVGTFTVTLVVHDGIEPSAPATVTVTIANRAPTASPGGPYAGVRGVPVAFDGGGSADPDGDPLSYAWDFGDGSNGTGPTPTHSYATVGSFTVTLVVSDGFTSSAPVQATVSIANRAPVANAGGPYSGTRVAPVQLTGAGSSDPDGDPLTYAWSFGDGAVGTGATPSHLYAALGTFTVTLTVSDGFTSSAPVTTTVTITNVGPVANAGADRTVLRRSVVALDGRASSDPDGTIAAYSWRQLSGPAVTLANASTAQPSFTAPNTGSSVVLDFELEVTDADGATAVDVVRITVIK